MQPRRVLGAFARLALPCLFLSAAASAGCDDTVQGTGGAPDGRFHPAKSGVAIDEAPACDSLLNTITKRTLALGCVGTSPVCPGFVRKETAQQCAKYDEGTVQGCVKYINESTDCDSIAQRIADCAFEAIPDTAPTGCPAM